MEATREVTINIPYSVSNRNGSLQWKVRLDIDDVIRKAVDDVLKEYEEHAYVCTINETHTHDVLFHLVYKFVEKK